MNGCTHLDEMKEVTPSADGCEDCLRIGDTWVHLRLCMTCGHVGCCDNSRNRHATKHFHSSGHPIIKSFEPGEDWGWCYVDGLFMDATAWPVRGFEHQHALDDAHLHAYATSFDLDVDRFDQDLEQHRYAGKIQDDLRSGIESGVRGTPTLFLNGVRYEGITEKESLLGTIWEAAAP